MSYRRTGSIEVDQFIRATPARVWAALTDPETHARWWAPGDVADVVGHEFHLEMPGFGSVPCRVVASEPHERFVYTFNEVSLGELSTLLKTRADVLRRTQRWMMAGLAALVALSFALALSVGRGILRQLGGEPAYARDVVQRIASGDMSQTVNLHAGDNSSLLYAMAQMQTRLAEVVLHVRQNSDSLATARRRTSSRDTEHHAHTRCAG